MPQKIFHYLIKLNKHSDTQSISCKTYESSAEAVIISILPQDINRNLLNASTVCKQGDCLARWFTEIYLLNAVHCWYSLLAMWIARRVASLCRDYLPRGSRRETHYLFQ